jgi:hypothetical protein
LDLPPIPYRVFVNDGPAVSAPSNVLRVAAAALRLAREYDGPRLRKHRANRVKV